MNGGIKICTWKKHPSVKKTCNLMERCKTEEKGGCSDFGHHKQVLHTKYGSDHAHLQNLKAIEIDSLKYIGFGTFSTVKKGYSKIYKDDIAVKIILLRDKSNRSNNRKYLRREIKLWRELSIHKHKNILSLKEDIKTNKYLYMITELLERGNLQAFLLKTPINESTGRTIFHNIVEAVCYCHGKKIAHRDIKPENILLGKGETIKLADFSFVTRENPVTNEHCGTHAMLSPDQRSGKSYNPFISDIWQVGLTLYMMLFRRLPYTKQKKKALLRQIQGLTDHHKGVPFPNNNTSFECKELIAGMLTIDPRFRLAIEEIKLSPWLATIPK